MNVVNLFGGPGTGKSTTAAGLFHLMKLANMKVELVTEFAKDLVWDDRSTDDQVHILGEQYHRLYRLKNKVDYVVTDSPLFLSIVYGQNNTPPSWSSFVNDLYNTFTNTNIWLRRVKPYHAAGRYQDERGARALDDHISDLLGQWGQQIHLQLPADEHAPRNIFTYLEKR